MESDALWANATKFPMEKGEFLNKKDNKKISQIQAFGRLTVSQFSDGFELVDYSNNSTEEVHIENNLEITTYDCWIPEQHHIILALARNTELEVVHSFPISGEKIFGMNNLLIQSFDSPIRKLLWKDNVLYILVNKQELISYTFELNKNGKYEINKNKSLTIDNYLIAPDPSVCIQDFTYSATFQIFFLCHHNRMALVNLSNEIIKFHTLYNINQHILSIKSTTGNCQSQKLQLKLQNKLTKVPEIILTLSNELELKIWDYFDLIRESKPTPFYSIKLTQSNFVLDINKCNYLFEIEPFGQFIYFSIKNYLIIMMVHTFFLEWNENLHTLKYQNPYISAIKKHVLNSPLKQIGFVSRKMEYFDIILHFENNTTYFYPIGLLDPVQAEEEEICLAKKEFINPEYDISESIDLNQVESDHLRKSSLHTQDLMSSKSNYISQTASKNININSSSVKIEAKNENLFNISNLKNEEIDLSKKGESQKQTNIKACPQDIILRESFIKDIITEEMQSINDNVNGKIQKTLKDLENKVSCTLTKMQEDIPHCVAKNIENALPSEFSKQFQVTIKPVIEKYCQSYLDQSLKIFEKGDKFFNERITVESQKIHRIKNQIENGLNSFVEIQKMFQELIELNKKVLDVKESQEKDFREVLTSLNLKLVELINKSDLLISNQQKHVDHISPAHEEEQKDEEKNIQAKNIYTNPIVGSPIGHLQGQFSDSFNSYMRNPYPHHNFKQQDLAQISQPLAYSFPGQQQIIGYPSYLSQDHHYKFHGDLPSNFQAGIPQSQIIYSNQTGIPGGSTNNSYRTLENELISSGMQSMRSNISNKDTKKQEQYGSLV